MPPPNCISIWLCSKKFRIDDIPMHKDLTIYAKIVTYKATAFTKAGQVPVVINAQDIKDVENGNVVRIVLVDPKSEFQTSQFESLRLSPTQDAVKEGKKTERYYGGGITPVSEDDWLDLLAVQKSCWWELNYTPSYSPPLL